MAITIDTVTPANNGSSSTSTLVFNHVVNIGSNSVLVVCVGNTGSLTVQSVKVGASTFLSQIAQVSGGTSITAYQYILKNPPTGTQSITITFSSTTRIAAAAITLFGVDQNTSYTTNTASLGLSGSGTASVTVTSNVGELVIDTLSKTLASETATKNASQDDLFYSKSTQSSSPATCAGSTKSGASPSVTMSWTFPARAWAIIATSFKPAATGYTHSVNGVAAASIASINGVATANIAKVNGV